MLWILARKGFAKAKGMKTWEFCQETRLRGRKEYNILRWICLLENTIRPIAGKKLYIEDLIVIEESLKTLKRS
tara:strand:+ start:495 stop:713 length:219 start_codon:yes stop_codon:yes gene_type:complete